MLLSSAVARADWSVWVERSTVKVLPELEPGPSLRAELEAAGNEWESFQVALRCEQTPITGIDLELSELEGPEGAIILLDRTTTYLEWLIELENPSECFMNPGCHSMPWEYVREAGRFPDPLIPFNDPYDDAHDPVGAPFDLDPDVTRAILVDLYVPGDAPAGNYTGQVTVSAPGQSSVPIEVSLTVWEFQLPDERRVGTSYGYSSSQLRRFHGGPEGPDEAEMARLTRNYEVALHEHHIDITTINGPVEFQFDGEGTLIEVDWNAYDAAVGSRLNGEFYPDGQPPVRFNAGRFTPGHGHGGMTEDQWAQAAAAFAEHLEDRGWLDRVFLYSADEPFLIGHEEAFQTIPADAALLDRYTDLWQGHVLATNPLDERLVGAVDIWCPVTPMYGDWLIPPITYPSYEEYEERRAQGEELWFYVCNANFPPWAGYDIDARLGHEPRIVKWGAFHEEATGFLFWRVNYWYSADPWSDVANLDEFGDLFARNGDGILIYPGDHDGTTLGTGSPPHVAMDGPVLSYRLKMIRDGLEDWEMFILARELGAEQYTIGQVERAFKSFGVSLDSSDYDPDHPPWTLDDTVLHDARRNVAAMILHRLYPQQYPDPEEPVEVDPEEPPLEPDLDQEPGEGMDVGPDPAELPDDGSLADADEGDGNLDQAAEMEAEGCVPERGEEQGCSGCSLEGRQDSGPALLLVTLLAFLGISRRSPGGSKERERSHRPNRCRSTS